MKYVRSGYPVKTASAADMQNKRRIFFSEAGYKDGSAGKEGKQGRKRNDVKYKCRNSAAARGGIFVYVLNIGTSTVIEYTKRREGQVCLSF